MRAVWWEWCTDKCGLRALSQWFRGSVWKHVGPEHRATLSTLSVCSGQGRTSARCLPAATSAAQRKANQPLLQTCYWQMKYFKGLLLKCPFRAESWKALPFSVPGEGDWGMGRLSALPKVTQEVSELTRNSTQDSCSYTAATTTGRCFLRAEKH